MKRIAGSVRKCLSAMLAAALLVSELPMAVSAGYEPEQVRSVELEQEQGMLPVPAVSQEPAVLYATDGQTTDAQEEPTAEELPALVGAGVALKEPDLTNYVLVGMSGAYYTETTEKILARINEIRLEACKEGVKSPATGKPLTEADYVPIEWSADLEAIARLRAAEATVNQGHTRPNGTRCFTVQTATGKQSWAENLAWNWTGLMQGIEQFYGEKSAWVNETAGAVTGHYTSMINPGYQYVGMGCFRLSTGGWYATAQEFGNPSYDTYADATKDDTVGDCVQEMEISPDKITKLEATGKLAKAMVAGTDYKPALTVQYTAENAYGNATDYKGAYAGGGTWTSSDESVATVSATGAVHGVAEGKTTISVTCGAGSLSWEMRVYPEGTTLVELTAPTKTTYKIGEKIDLTGGQVKDLLEDTTQPLKADMISGFDTTTAGIKEITVTTDTLAASFSILVMADPALEAELGQKLSEVSIPADDNGTFTWNDDSQVFSEVGEQSIDVTYTPKDTTRFQSRTDLKAKVMVTCVLDDRFAAEFHDTTFVYNGAYQTPAVTVSGLGRTLQPGTHYTTSYALNKHVGTAQMTITAVLPYKGQIEKTFEITPAKLTIRPKNVRITTEDALPERYDYVVEGLMEGDALVKEPVLVCDAVSAEQAGKYPIKASGADAGADYTITYEEGVLQIASENISYTVTFDVLAHGTAPAAYNDVQAGNTIEAPADPVADGYVFLGWFKDAAGESPWNFETDIVQSDLTLYAGWLKAGSAEEFKIREIPDVIYTGKALKPTVAVYDGETLLKAGKDYQLIYRNNMNVYQGEASEQAPCVVIVGKGNYTSSVRVNFRILPVQLADAEHKAAAGITVKCKDQLTVNTAKDVACIQSVKAKKALKQNVDYTAALYAVRAWSADQALIESGQQLNDTGMIPKGYRGSFRLVITGQGNYAGTIEQTIQVADKQYLLSGAKIALGKHVSKVSYSGAPVVLTPAYYDSKTGTYYRVREGQVTEETLDKADVFTVMSGKTCLIYKKDYEISYVNNDGVGKATLIVQGIGAYSGTKTASFQITGLPFTAKTVSVEGLQNVTYTGRANIQNDVTLIYAKGTAQEQKLIYGEHYAISYKADTNVKCGTVPMTFTALPASGFAGSFTTSFRILPADITDSSQVTQDAGMQDIKVAYQKSGATPADQILLWNQSGKALKAGTDYTVKLLNNKAVADRTAAKAPVAVIQGKGNYTGKLEVPFTIEPASLTADTIQVTQAAVAYAAAKADTYAYTPKITVKDGKSALKAGVDYQVTYVKNTQADYTAYLQKCKDGTAAAEDVPRAVITATENGNYRVGETLEVPLAIYQTRFSKKTVVVEVEEATYTGAQVTPAVKVYDISSGSRVLITDYTCTYGANITAGKKKGSVTVTGLAPYYGGSLTVKFDIQSKQVSWK